MGDTKVEPAPASAAPVISSSTSTSATKMGQIIDTLSGGTPLGETDTGKAWCLKALHPADVNVLTAPMPVNETRQYSSVQFLQMDIMSCPATFSTALTWDLEIYLLRDPVLLFAFIKKQAGATDVVGYIFSRQYGASDYLNAFVSIRDQVEKFRVTSHSITAYFDGASLSDQGHIVAGQTEYPRMTAAGMLPGLTGELQGILPFTYYQDTLPSYDNIVQTSRAFQGPASAGVYAPSKLQSLGEWTLTNQAQCLLGSSYGSGGAGQFNALGRSISWAENSKATWLATFPYLTILSTDAFERIYPQVDTSLTTIFFKGLAATSQMRLTTRWTMDMMVRPGSSYAPFVRMPPVEDRLALRMYAEISRRMPDAYPGNHNALGAILPIIGKIASAVLPSLANSISGWFQDKQSTRNAAIAQGLQPKMPSFAERLAATYFSGEGNNTVPGMVKQMTDHFITPLGYKIKDPSAPKAPRAPRKPRGRKAAAPSGPTYMIVDSLPSQKRGRYQRTGRNTRRKY